MVLIHTPVLAVAALASFTAYKSFSPQLSEADILLNENIEALTNGENDINYFWSSIIDCPGWFTGDYCICEENGTGNLCTEPGAKTCQCGVNCK